MDKVGTGACFPSYFRWQKVYSDFHGYTTDRNKLKAAMKYSEFETNKQIIADVFTGKSRSILTSWFISFIKPALYQTLRCSSRLSEICSVVIIYNKGLIRSVKGDVMTGLRAAWSASCELWLRRFLADGKQHECLMNVYIH